MQRTSKITRTNQQQLLLQPASLISLALMQQANYQIEHTNHFHRIVKQILLLENSMSPNDFFLASADFIAPFFSTAFLLGYHASYPGLDKFPPCSIR
jgi:hypothetical protein